MCSLAAVNSRLATIHCSRRASRAAEWQSRCEHTSAFEQGRDIRARQSDRDVVADSSLSAYPSPVTVPGTIRTVEAEGLSDSFGLFPPSDPQSTR